VIPFFVMPKLSFVSGSPSVHYSIFIYGHAMRIFLTSCAWNFNDIYVLKFFNKSWLLFVIFFAVTKLKTISFTPWISPTILINCKAMCKSCSDFDNFGIKF
jgi:hypothetical protein